MTLKTYQSGDTRIFFKILQGQAHPRFARSTHRRLNLGIAFRTGEAPIGYLPFYGVNDFNLDGETSFGEEVLARLPVNFSSAASPHTLLVRAAVDDVEFTASGNEDLTDIQTAVKQDLLRHAMRAASGVFVDGVMLALGGPAIKTLVNQIAAPGVKRFILSRAMNATAKRCLKSQAGFDVDKFLSGVP